MDQSAALKAIGGVLLVDVDGEPKLICIEDMKHSKCLSTGQVFTAVKVLNNKSTDDYNKLWPRFKNDDDEISNDWKTIEEVRTKCESDYDFLVEVCAQLQEEVPQIIERNVVEKQLEKFRSGQLQY